MKLKAAFSKEDEINKAEYRNGRANNKHSYKHRGPTEIIGDKSKPVSRYRASEIAEAVKNSRKLSRVHLCFHRKREHRCYNVVDAGHKTANERKCYNSQSHH